MKSAAYVLAIWMFFASPADILAREFNVYPGARLEDVYDASQPDTGGKMSKAPKVIVFTTGDSFESVVSFYRGIGREYRVSGGTGKPMKLPSGQEFREAYFIFDNAIDLSTSKHWVRIQRPYLGREQTGVNFQGIHRPARDLTAIIEEDRRSYP